MLCIRYSEFGFDSELLTASVTTTQTLFDNVLLEHGGLPMSSLGFDFWDLWLTSSWTKESEDLGLSIFIISIWSLTVQFVDLTIYSIKQNEKE